MTGNNSRKTKWIRRANKNIDRSAERIYKKKKLGCARGLCFPAIQMGGPAVKDSHASAPGPFRSTDVFRDGSGGPEGASKAPRKTLQAGLHGFFMKPKNISLLFLSQGLRSAEISKLRALLKRFEVDLHMVPLRLWFRWCCRRQRDIFAVKGDLQRSPEPLVNYIYGEMIRLSCRNEWGADCIYFIYKQVLKQLAYQRAMIRRIHPFEGTAFLRPDQRASEAVAEPALFDGASPAGGSFPIPRLILPWDSLAARGAEVLGASQAPRQGGGTGQAGHGIQENMAEKEWKRSKENPDAIEYIIKSMWSGHLHFGGLMKTDSILFLDHALPALDLYTDLGYGQPHGSAEEFLGSAEGSARICASLYPRVDGSHRKYLLLT